MKEPKLLLLPYDLKMEIEQHFLTVCDHPRSGLFNLGTLDQIILGCDQLICSIWDAIP